MNGKFEYIEFMLFTFTFQNRLIDFILNRKLVIYFQTMYSYTL
jgi:hypothetical protein